MIGAIVGAFQFVTGAVNGAITKADQEASAREKLKEQREREESLTEIQTELNELAALENAAKMKRIAVGFVLLVFVLYVLKKTTKNG